MSSGGEVGSCSVAEVMGTEMFTVTPETAVSSARRLVQENDVHHMLVLDNGTLAGIVCRDDLRLADRDARVGDCMSSPVLCITPDTTLQEAVDIMGANDIDCLPVVTGVFLVGIVTLEALETANLSPNVDAEGNAEALAESAEDPYMWEGEDASALPAPRGDRPCTACGSDRDVASVEGGRDPAVRSLPARDAVQPALLRRCGALAPRRGGRLLVGCGRSGENASRQVERGGLKLDAALDHFRLGAAVRGAQAIDIGASTGGFTQVLLAAGVASVVAVDAGRGQLRDPAPGPPGAGAGGNRLEAAAAGRTAGPFDFFTVDVSFVAARNMLRSLAFRLRPGAQGVVLLKPQFELPDHLVRDGDVCDPALRRQALETFTRKAERLGFRVLAQVDSPVPGGNGTVEILTHLQFDGRSDTLPRPVSDVPRRATAAEADHQAPKPGQSAKRSSRGRTAEAAVAGALDWFAVVTPGAEEVAASEIAALPGAIDPQVVHGGVEFRGPLDLACAPACACGSRRGCCCGWGRCARASSASCATSWRACRGKPLSPPGRRCEPASRDALPPVPHRRDRRGAARRHRRSPGHRSRQGPRQRPPRAAGPAARRGRRLHRQRRQLGPAPAPPGVAHSRAARRPCASHWRRPCWRWRGWQGDEALLDPMCGAGTIPIEAAAIARTRSGDRSPIRVRVLAGADDEARARWAELDAVPRSRAPRRPPFPIVGRDRDATVVEVARRNAERGGVAAVSSGRGASLSEVQAPAEIGLLIANPPYGRRLGRRGTTPGAVSRDGRRPAPSPPRLARRRRHPRPQSGFGLPAALPITATHALAARRPAR